MLWKFQLRAAGQTLYIENARKAHIILRVIEAVIWIIREPYPETYTTIRAFAPSDSLFIFMLFFLFYSTKSYIQMAAILDVIRALRSSQPAIVRRRQTRVSRFVLSRRCVRGFKREPRFCHRSRRLRVNIDVSSSLVPPLARMEMPVATAPRGHIHAHRQSSRATLTTTRYIFVRLLLRPAQSSFAYWFAIEYSLLSGIPPRVVIFRTISLAISTNRAKLARNIAAISIRW